VNATAPARRRLVTGPPGCKAGESLLIMTMRGKAGVDAILVEDPPPGKSAAGAWV
jgi:hypothetical protein